MTDSDQYIPEDRYREIVATMPIPSVDIMVATEVGVLLTRRVQEPAKGEWFWPGGRIFKGESRRDAVHRVAREELGITVDITRGIGVYEHFWDRSAFGSDISKHAICHTFLVHPTAEPVEPTLNDEHNEYRFATTLESNLHKHVTRPLRDANLP